MSMLRMEMNCVKAAKCSEAKATPRRKVSTSMIKGRIRKLSEEASIVFRTQLSDKIGVVVLVKLSGA